MSIDKALEFMTAVIKTPASTIAGIVAAGLLIHMAWVEGQIPGVIGYAKADEIQVLREEVSTLKSDVSLLRVSTLETNLFNLQMEICKLENGPGALRTEYERRKSSLQSEYRKLTATGTGTNYRFGDPYPVPDC